MRTTSPSGRCNSIQPFIPALFDEQVEAFPDEPSLQSRANSSWFGWIRAPASSAMTPAVILVLMTFSPATLRRRECRANPPVIVPWSHSDQPVLNAAILLLSVHFPLRPPQFSWASHGHGPR